MGKNSEIIKRKEAKLVEIYVKKRLSCGTLDRQRKAGRRIIIVDGMKKLL